MRRFVRIAAGALSALALALPAAANTPQAAALKEGGPPAASPHATAVVMRLDGGIRPVPRWLWYASSGVAEYTGLLGNRGRYSATVDFAAVDRVVVDAQLCTRPVKRGFPPGNDMLSYHLSVRCGDRWRYLTEYDTSDEPDPSAVRHAVRELEHIAWNLTWQPTDDRSQLPDSPPLFHTARAEASP